MLDPPDPSDDRNFPLTPEDRATEALLGNLRPAATTIDRDGLLFRAGRAAGEADARRTVRRQLLLWRAAAAVLLGGVGLILAVRAGPAVIERERIVRVPADPATLPAPVTHQPVPNERPGDGSLGDGSPPPRLPAALDPVPPISNRPLIPPPDADYLSLRDAMLRWGVRAIPVTRGPVATAHPARAPTIEELLDLPPRQAPGADGATERNESQIPWYFGERL